MNKRFIKISSCIVAILALLIGSLFILPLHSVVAAPDDTSIMKKTLANAITSCYNSSYIHKDITPAGQFKIEDIFVYHFSSSKKGKVLILDDLGGSINCEQVFLGSKKTQGLNSLFNKNPTTPTNLGYVQSGDNNPSSTRCMSVSYKHASAEAGGNMVNYTSNSLCFGVMSDGKIDMDSFPSGGIPSSECIDPICLSANVQGKVFVNVLGNDGLHAEWEVAYFDTNMFAGGDGTKWDDLYKEVSNAVSGMNNDNGYANVSTNQTKTDDPGAFATYTINDYGEAAKAAFKYYTGSSNMDSQKFNQEDIDYLLDKAYAKMRSDGIISEDSTCFVGKDEALNQGTSYAHYNEGKKMWCPVYLNTGLAAGKTYNVVGNSLKGLYAASPEEILRIITKRDDGYATVGEMCNERAEERYDEFVNAWNEENAKGDKKDQAKLDYYKEQQQKIRQMINKPGGTYKTENGQTTCLTLPTVDGAPDTPPDTSGDNDGGTTGGDGSNGGNGGGSPTSDLEQCFNNASSLGWILCPVLKFVGVAADGLWQEISNHWLVTDYEQYKADNNNGIYVAWGSIRNIANIVFAIVLLVVIISQLTGLGISNYGIKKILPTLIILVILINISFLICQLLIDISNVAGSSVKSIADFIRLKIPSSSGIGTGDVFRGTLASLFEGAGILGIGYGAYVLVTMNGAAVLIPLLISVLGVLISIVFAFIILAVRQAGILVLVVISPLAIICYALPNTKSLFDKWKKLFTSLLFIYPVCAVCIYGGQVVSSLMLASSNTGFMYNLVAMLLQIVPIFFIPSLIRGSLALAGNIGNRIAQMGNSIGGRATGALRKSEAVDRLRTTGQFNAAQRNREFFNRLSQRKGVLGAVGRYGGRKMDSAVARYNKMRLDEHQAALYGRSINDGSIQRSLASLDIKDMDRRVAEDVDNLIQDKNNGIDTTDVNSINTAFQAALAEVDADPTNEAKMIRAKALASLLMGKGDTGQSVMLESMRSRVNATTGVGAQGSEAMRALGGYITYNDKWMASIKGKDTGAYKFMNDLAASQDIKSNSDYAMAGAKKVTQSTIGGMGDSWYRSMETALGDGSFDASATNQDALRTYADLATKALTDPRYAGTIQKERLDTLNRLRQAAYDLDRKEWKTAHVGKTDADYEREFGKFQVLKNPGDKLVVPHQRATVPTGFTESGVWVGGGAGPTRQQQIAYDEWARHAAEVDRHNSQNQP